MAEAAVSLSPNRATQKMLRHRSAVMTLARMRAKKAVLFALRAQGLKPQHFSVRDIAVLTDYYLNQHRTKLMAEAAEAIATWPGFTPAQINDFGCADGVSAKRNENPKSAPPAGRL